MLILKFLVRLPLGLLCAASVCAAELPDTPTAQQILEALTPKPAVVAPAPAPAPAKARKTRNLSVEAAPTDSADTAAPAAPTPPPPAAVPPAINLAIQFERNSDRVQPASVKLLSSLADALQAPALLHARFLVEGHTDGSGQAAYNLRLSAQRAAQVKRILMRNLVDPSRIVTEGKGSTELLNPADPAAPENRRVRIVMLGQ
ncbi:MAG: OmpA family protein [Sphingomonadaceae bacterium]